MVVPVVTLVSEQPLEGVPPPAPPSAADAPPVDLPPVPTDAPPLGGAPPVDLPPVASNAPPVDCAPPTPVDALETPPVGAPPDGPPPWAAPPSDAPPVAVLTFDVPPTCPPVPALEPPWPLPPPELGDDTDEPLQAAARLTKIGIRDEGIRNTAGSVARFIGKFTVYYTGTDSVATRAAKIASRVVIMAVSDSNAAPTR